MNRRYLAATALALLLSDSLAAAPFVISDAYTAGVKPTHCGLLLNSAAKVDVPVALDAAGNPYCRFDIGTVGTGAHVVKATAVLLDAVWGRLESAESLPLSFSRPAAPGVPSSLKLRAE